MRDGFERIDVFEVDIIDADPLAFGPATDAGDPSPKPPRPRPLWLGAAAVGVLAALMVATAGLVWRPWVNDYRLSLTFPSPSSGSPTLTGQLVFDEPPADLTAAGLGVVGDSSFNNLINAKGYFFADPEATFNLGQGGSGRWATFFAAPQGNDGTPALEAGPGDTELTVRGTPGVLSTSIGSQTVQLTFGPIDDYIFSVVTSELSQAETLAFAEASSLADGVPVISDSSVLGGMRPLGSIAEFGSVFALALTAADPATAQANIVTAQYGLEGERFTVTSRVASDSALPLLRFFIGTGSDAEVHGQAAVAFVTDSSESLLAFGHEFGSVVAWLEGGRLVMVTGKTEMAALIDLADSVRPATRDEWAEVARVAADTATDVSPGP